MGVNPKRDHIKVVIAEDEPVILKNLSRRIEEADESFEVVGTAYNGEKAFQLICETKPDLVFTDIIMPVCDGITLITRLRECEAPLCDLPVVIISGYDDFSYAQSAIKLGVTDYLLKPVVTAEFNKLLEDLKGRILSRRVISQREILRSSLRGGGCELPGQLEGGAFGVCLICLGNLSDRITTAAHEAEYRARWQQIPWKRLVPAPGGNPCSWWLVDENVANQKFLIFALEGMADNEVYSQLCGKLCRMVPDFTVNLCYFSRPAAASEFGSVANKLRLSMQNNVRVDHSACFDENRQASVGTDLLSLAVLGKLSAASSADEIEKIVQCCLDAWRVDDLSQMQIQKGFEMIIAALNGSGMLPQTSGDLFTLHQQIAELFSAPLRKDGADRVERIGMLIADTVRKNNFAVENVSQFADEVEAYILAHYSECISMNSIADRYNCSQAYISKIFKKVKNESPIKFITRIRMEKAIRMMTENPQMDFRLIGEAVGYCDQHYFSRSFKQFTGSTLTEYRNRIHQGPEAD